MECSCVYFDPSSGDLSAFNDVTMPRARKAHKCCECGREIQRGETYESNKGCWDGQIEVYKTCSDCLSVRDEFFCDGWEFECIWDYMANHIKDMGDQLPWSGIANLTPAARDKVCELIEQNWEEKGYA